jgi:uncharacterized protein YcnI
VPICRGQNAAVRRLLPAAALVALLVPATASAHGSIQPTAATAGVVQRFVVTVPNTLLGGPRIVAVTVTAPDGATIESAEPGERWQVRVDGRTAVWEGGPLEGLQEDFAFDARMPEAEGTYAFRGRERYDQGAGAVFPLAVTVTRGAAPTGSSTYSSGTSRIWIAVAAGGAVILLGAGALILRRRT